MRYLFAILLALTLMGLPATSLADDTPDAPEITANAPADDAVAEGPDATPDEADEATDEAAVEEPVPEDGGDATEVVETEPEPIEDAAVPETDEEAGVLLGQVIEAAQGGHWMIFGGGLFLFLVWVFNKLGLAAKIGRKAIPYVTVAISTLTIVAIALATGGDIGAAVMTGLVDGGLAIALWELIAKKITSTKSDGTPRVSESTG